MDLTSLRDSVIHVKHTANEKQNKPASLKYSGDGTVRCKQMYVFGAQKRESGGEQRQIKGETERVGEGERERDRDKERKKRENSHMFLLRRWRSLKGFGSSVLFIIHQPYYCLSLFSGQRRASAKVSHTHAHSHSDSHTYSLQGKCVNSLFD